MENNSEISLSVRHITKTYPGVIALNDVSIDFRRGEVHALMGENGAGKSTLMKIVSGATDPDDGEFLINGKSFKRITPAISQSEGIQIVHQEQNMIPALSVSENIFLGAFIGNGITVNTEKMRTMTEGFFKEYEIPGIRPEMIVGELTVAQIQLVEIIKAISRKAEVLILDEPTSPLTLYETELLFRIIEKLKKQGVTIIYISHRMSEIYRISDRITVLRDGRLIGTNDIADVSHESLIRMMVGRTLTETYPERKAKPGDVVLDVQNISGNGMKDISFNVRRGEILGFAGLIGAGRTELMRVVYGAEPKEGGRVLLEGRDVRIHSPTKAVDLGIGLLPEDRKQHGVILELSIKQNIILPSIKRISRWLFINRSREKELIEEHINSLSIKTPSMNQLVKNLSGGNQQKVVVSKWLASKCKVLIFDEPTRGIDVGAKQEIYNLMNELTAQGISIIMVSSEMEELIGMSDRIIVLREGKIAGELSSRSEFSQEAIMEIAAQH